MRNIHRRGGTPEYPLPGRRGFAWSVMHTCLRRTRPAQHAAARRSLGPRVRARFAECWVLRARCRAWQLMPEQQHPAPASPHARSPPTQASLASLGRSPAPQGPHAAFMPPGDTVPAGQPRHMRLMTPFPGAQTGTGVRGRALRRMGGGFVRVFEVDRQAHTRHH